MRIIALSLIASLGMAMSVTASVAANANEEAIRSLYTAMMQSKGPKEFSFDIVADDASKEPTHLLIHVTGAGQSGKDLQDVQGVKGLFQITVEGSQGKNAIHASAEARVVDGNLYVRIGSLDLSGVSKDLEQFKVQYVGQWYQLPMKEYAQKAVAQNSDIDKSVAELSKTFIVTKRTVSKDTQYVIRIRPAVVRQILSRNVPGAQAFFSMNGMAAFTSDNVFERMTLAMHARAKAPAVPSLFDAAAKQTSSNPVDAKVDVSFRMKGVKTVTVAAPGKFISLQDAINGAMNGMQINPPASAFDAQRKSDINVILNASYQYSIDNQGKYPAVIPATPTQICATGKVCSGVSLDALMDRYLIRIPRDPTLTDASPISGYTIKVQNNRMTVIAPLAEHPRTKEGEDLLIMSVTR